MARFSHMKVMIELPYAAYDQLRNKCDQSSPEFRLLINGCVETRAGGNHVESIVQILCEKPEAVKILRLANRVRPDAVPAIIKSLAVPADQ